MLNANLREIKLYEFNSALFYVSDILEIKKMLEQITKEKDAIEAELNGWEIENKINFNSYISTNDRQDLLDIISQLKKKLYQKEKEINNLKRYLDLMHDLVTKILEIVLEDTESLELTEGEIQAKFIEEYVYIILNCYPNNKKLKQEMIFSTKTESIAIAYIYYCIEKCKALGMN